MHITIKHVCWFIIWKAIYQSGNIITALYHIYFIWLILKIILFINKVIGKYKKKSGVVDLQRDLDDINLSHNYVE